MPTQLPDKLYFRVGEVSDLTDVPAYVLRFWESEFPQIKPKRTASGQRLYRKHDIEIILTIKSLLYEKKYTIEGARQYLKTKQQPTQSLNQSTIDEIRKELLEIRNLLKPN